MFPVRKAIFNPVRSRYFSSRMLLLSFLLVLALIGLAWIADRYGTQGYWLNDFVEYWSAGRLNLAGGNPYGAGDLLVLQRSIGWSDSRALVMWNPPPTLTLVMPFALFSYLHAYMAWIGVNVMLLIFLIDQLWLVYGGRPSDRWLALVIGLSFMPTLFLFRIGQIGGFIFVGLGGFLLAERKGRWWAAGAALPLVFIKPHVAYLFWAVLALWWLRERQWRLAGGALLAMGGAWLLPTLINPQVNQQYLTATTTAPPYQWVTMTWGAVLRLWFGWEQTWLSFIPPLIGLIGVGVYIGRTRRVIRTWTQDLPWILLVSTASMAYGWPHDLVILLPAVLQMTVWTRYGLQRAAQWCMVAAFTLFEMAAFLLSRFEASAVYYVWMAPVLLIAYWWLRRQVQGTAVAGTGEL